ASAGRTLTWRCCRSPRPPLNLWRTLAASRLCADGQYSPFARLRCALSGLEEVVMLAVAAFTIGAAVSLATSWLLVSRLERIGERLLFSEALLGIVAALAVDAPEITAAITALTNHQQRIGAGVVLGSNVFNLAALLGLSAAVAGRLRLHRKVIVLSGTI